MRKQEQPGHLETARLILRQWQQTDYAPYAALNADPLVMAFFTATMDEQQSHVMVDCLYDLIQQRGWGIWAVERKSDGAFLGSVGLHIPRATLPFTPCVEVGWRLAKAYWGQGYATEAAEASLTYGFEVLELPEIVSFTSLLNTRSQSVMQRLGMKTDAKANFGHPDVPEASPLREHCLYTMSRQDWEKRGL